MVLYPRKRCRKKSRERERERDKEEKLMLPYLNIGHQHVDRWEVYFIV